MMESTGGVERGCKGAEPVRESDWRRHQERERARPVEGGVDLKVPFEQETGRLHAFLDVMGATCSRSGRLAQALGMVSAHHHASDTSGYRDTSSERAAANGAKDGNLNRLAVTTSAGRHRREDG